MKKKGQPELAFREEDRRKETSMHAGGNPVVFYLNTERENKKNSQVRRGEETANCKNVKMVN